MVDWEVVITTEKDTRTVLIVGKYPDAVVKLAMGDIHMVHLLSNSSKFSIEVERVQS